MLKKSGSYPNIPYAIMWNETMLEIVENSSARATWCPKFVHSCLNWYLPFPRYNRDCVSLLLMPRQSPFDSTTTLIYSKSYRNCADVILRANTDPSYHQTVAAVGIQTKYFMTFRPVHLRMQVLNVPSSPPLAGTVTAQLRVLLCY